MESWTRVGCDADSSGPKLSFKSLNWGDSSEDKKDLLIIFPMFIDYSHNVWMITSIIFFFAPCCFNIILAFLLLFLLRSLCFDLMFECQQLESASCSGLTTTNDPHNKLLMAETTITDIENCSVLKLNVGGCLEIIKLVLECCFTLTWFTWIIDFSWPENSNILLRFKTEYEKKKEV